MAKIRALRGLGVILVDCDLSGKRLKAGVCFVQEPESERGSALVVDVDQENRCYRLLGLPSRSVTYNCSFLVEEESRD